MGNEKNNLDDLISGSGGQPIVMQQSGGDKKLLYILLIILVILFILAIGVIAYLGGKYFSQNSTKTPVNQPKVAVVTPVKKQIIKPDNSDIRALNKMVKEDKAAQKNLVKSTQSSQNAQQNVIAQAATAASGSKALSQADLAKIAALVAQDLAKLKAPAKPTNAARPATNEVNNKKVNNNMNKKDAALVASLQNAQTDTLKNEQLGTGKLSSNVQAGSSKKVDTFNKVVLTKQKGGSDDELAKLSEEIDAIVQSKDATQKEGSAQNQEQILQEVQSRQNEMRFIVVKRGDTLSSIANRAYGRASAYMKIYKANPGLVKNPNRIYVGMKLRVPVDEEYKKQQEK